MSETEEQVQGRKNEKKPQYETMLCPRCGRVSDVSVGNTLVACWRCAMFGVDRLKTGEAKESEIYDWPATIEALKEAMGVSKESQVAFKLGIVKSFLTQIKHSLRPMPKEALKLIREKWPDALKTAQTTREYQATEKAQDGPEFSKNGPPARVVATPRVLLNKTSNENKDLQDQKSRSLTS